jgi:hypothetical protein
MRVPTLVTAAVAGVLLAVPARMPAQVNVRVQVGARLGPAVSIFAYSPDRYGPWRTDYLRWTPIVLYDVDGHYYQHAVRGARPIVVYSYNNEYFLPPADQAWVGFDKRYDYGRRPIAIDEGRVRPYPPVVSGDRRLGDEIVVWAYSPARAGAWRRTYRLWTPITVYEYQGRYYPNRIPGTRPVELYRYHGDYFLPPHQTGWVGVDKRYDYKLQPNDDDRRRARTHP